MQSDPEMFTEQHARKLAQWFSAEKAEVVDQLENHDPTNPGWYVDRGEWLDRAANDIGIVIDAEDDAWIAPLLAELQAPAIAEKEAIRLADAKRRAEFNEKFLGAVSPSQSEVAASMLQSASE